ncbi:ketol-acid reductoisomerase, chloroplastic, partial [Tanacetum coccineum]
GYMIYYERVRCGGRKRPVSKGIVCGKPTNQAQADNYLKIFSYMKPHNSLGLSCRNGSISEKALCSRKGINRAGMNDVDGRATDVALEGFISVFYGT